MTARVVVDTPGGGDWLAARRRGVTGTDIGALLGLHPWRTPLDVWQSKTGADPVEPSEPMVWGSKLEPLIRSHYAELHPGSVVEPAPGLLAHPDEPLLLGSLDGFAHAPDASRVLEIKTTRRSWADGALPDAYTAQVLWYLGVTGLEQAHVAVLFSGQRYDERVVDANPAWFDYAVTGGGDWCGALAWWDVHVTGGIMPDPDPVRDAATLPRLWRPDPTESVDLDAGLVTRLRDAKAAAAAAKADVEQLTAQVQAVMREATVGYVDGVPAVTWTGVKGRETVSVKELRRLAPDVAAQVVRFAEPSRVFRVKTWRQREGQGDRE